jgi:hypothetical protein
MIFRRLRSSSSFDGLGPDREKSSKSNGSEKPYERETRSAKKKKAPEVDPKWTEGNFTLVSSDNVAFRVQSFRPRPSVFRRKRLCRPPLALSPCSPWELGSPFLRARPSTQTTRTLGATSPSEV